MRARSVFNFYRPGYVPTGGPAEPWALQLPEMQITNESSVAGYANYMMMAMRNGVGMHGFDGKADRCDVQPHFESSVALADNPQALVDDATSRLIGENVNEELKTRMVNAVSSIVVPERRPDGSNAEFIQKQRENRATTAVLLTLVSPEFVVQK